MSVSGEGPALTKDRELCCHPWPQGVSWEPGRFCGMSGNRLKGEREPCARGVEAVEGGITLETVAQCGQ